MNALSDLLAVLELEPRADGGFTANNVPGPGTVVFGGQLLAQTVMAAAAVDPAKEVKSVHTVFARPGAVESPFDVDVEVMHSGRALGSVTVTMRQDAKVCARSLVLLDALDPDLIRHQVDAPAVGAPADAVASSHGGTWWEIRTVGGVDVSDPEAVGPASLEVWTRFPDAPRDPTVSQALLAYATDGFLIGTAMRPHPGVGQALAHVSIATTVITHTLTFHERFDAAQWLLLVQESPYAGRGRSYGRGQVFTEDGRLVASFVQENMIRG